MEESARRLIAAGAAVRVLRDPRLRGDIKLSYALDHFERRVPGRVVAEIGAGAGGFTTALVDRGAARVYAIDAGVGQLVGRLRRNDRVVDLEGHNIGSFDRRDVPERIDLVTIDLSYLAVADAVAQLEAMDMADDADLVALVKPMFELHGARPPTTRVELDDALAVASGAVNRGSWRVLGTCQSAIGGAGGTIEFFIHADRQPS